MGINGKEQLVALGFGKILAANRELDAVEVVNKLRQKNDIDTEGNSFGVNFFEGGTIDTYSQFVWETTMLKDNILNSAIEAACCIINVDQTVKNPKSEH